MSGSFLAATAKSGYVFTHAAGSGKPATGLQDGSKHDSVGTPGTRGFYPDQPAVIGRNPAKGATSASALLQ